jgi:phospholipid transport system substrate-binding protein
MAATKHHILISIVATGLVLVMAPHLPAVEDQPMEVLRENVSRGLAILNAPQYQSAEMKALQAEHMWALTREAFDFAVMARLVLAAHWPAFTPAQQQAFVREFAAYLRRAYLPDLLAKYNGERLEYVRQVLISKTRARVDVLVYWRDRAIPVTAKMILRAGTWKIYDISALGISAMQNYRAQFQSLLREEPPARVIDILRNRRGHADDG